MYSNAVNDRGWFLQQCEDAATFLYYHSPLAIPSLVHSEAYYRMIRGTTAVSFDGDIDWDDGLEFRMERRERWIESGREALLLIGEAALTMDLGPDRDLILADLKQVSALPFADVRIMPLALGRYDLQPWSLNLFEYDSEQPPVVNVESPRGGGFVDANTSQGTFFTGAFKLASAKSITAEEFFK
nr:Scr1 family TA system antitoxin-like transcriptional regulator [Glycomyces sambucus]